MDYGQVLANFLEAGLSDHVFVVVNVTKNDGIRTRGHFKFINHLANDPLFDSIVEKAWNSILGDP